jgi:hypothetical protein
MRCASDLFRLVSLPGAWAPLKSAYFFVTGCSYAPDIYLPCPIAADCVRSA